MNTEKIMADFTPLLEEGLLRLQRFNSPEPRDLQKFFGSTFATICNVAGIDPARATERINSWVPAAVTMKTLHSAVRELTAPTMADMAAARAKQEALEAELARDAAAHPLTARDRVLLERKNKPLAERTRDSILAELFEVRTGRIRLDSQDENGGWSAEELPGIVWEHLAADGRESVLQGELDRRDCLAHGVEYVPAPPAKRDHSLDMVRPMRG